VERGSIGRALTVGIGGKTSLTHIDHAPIQAMYMEEKKTLHPRSLTGKDREKKLDQLSLVEGGIS